MRKLVRRYKGRVAAAGLVLAALLAGLAGTTWGLVRAERETARAAAAEAVAGEERDKAVAAADAERRASKQVGRALESFADVLSENWVRADLASHSADRKLLGNLLKLWEAHTDSLGKTADAHAARAMGASKISLMYWKISQLDDAVSAWRIVLDSRTKLASLPTDEPKRRADLANAHQNLGHFLWELGEQKEAEVNHRSAVEIYETLSRKFPSVESYRSDLDNAKVNLKALLDESAQPGWKRAYSRVRSGMISDAVAEADTLSSVDSWDEGDLYNFACIYSLASNKLPAKRDEYAARAVALLRQAVAKGYTDAKHIAADDDLAPLRGRADFRAVLAELAARRELAPVPRERR